MVDLTAIILTKNEEVNIKDCIHSIRNLATRIIVVDSYSTDDTVKIAKSLGADLYKNAFVNYATQFNWALDHTNITTEWVLRIDADERFTDELVCELEHEINNLRNYNINGFLINMRIYFMGKWIKHGGIYPLKILRVFRYGTGRVEQRKMDEHILLSFGKASQLNSHANHCDFKDVTIWTSKHNWYATRECQDYFDQMNAMKLHQLSNSKTKIKRVMKNKFYYKLPIFIRPFLYFFYRYFIRLGFMDGIEGLIFHFLQAYWYRFLVDVKIYECKKYCKNYGDTGDLKA